MLLHLRILRFLQFLSFLADRYQNKYQSILLTTLSNLPGYVCGLKLSFILPTLQRHRKRVVKKKVSCFLKKDCLVLFRSKKKIKTFWDTQGIKGETISVWTNWVQPFPSAASHNLSYSWKSPQILQKSFVILIERNSMTVLIILYCNKNYWLKKARPKKITQTYVPVENVSCQTALSLLSTTVYKFSLVKESSNDKILLFQLFYR